MDRRRTIRREPHAEEPLARMRLRTGSELSVVNVSTSGALVESGTRLLPGTHVDVHVITREGRILVRCRVIRSFVCHLQADSVTYRGALVFDRSVDVDAAGQPFPCVLPDAGSISGNDYPRSVTVGGEHVRNHAVA